MGKPSRGTPADQRLKRNNPNAGTGRPSPTPRPAPPTPPSTPRPPSRPRPPSTPGRVP